MASLHTLNKTASASCFRQCLQACDSDSSLLLIEDGVYAAVDATDAYRDLCDCSATALYALADDVEARGIGSKIGARVQLIDYNRFVELCCQHQPVITWY